MISYTRIQSILDNELQKILDLPKITLENITAKPTATDPFCRTTLLPAQAQVIGIGAVGLRLDQGLYQIDLFYPQNSGNCAANNMGDTVMNHFVRGQYYTDDTIKIMITRIYRLPASSLVQTAYYRIPVMIEWNYYDNN